jgi:hypothetical protein
MARRKRNDEWTRFERHVRETLVPKMAESETVLVISPEFGDFDVEFALQIGASVLLEKPMLVVLPVGRTIPPKLQRLADRIITVDLLDDAEAAQKQIQSELKQFFTDVRKQ